MWTQTSGGHITEFNNTPFRLIEKKTLDCQFGKQYYKDKPRKSTRMMIQGSRKLGCPAHITVKVYEIFPEYAISETEVSCNSKKGIKNAERTKNEAVENSSDKSSKRTHKKKVLCLSSI